MCRILKINQKRTCVYTHATIQRLLELPHHDGIVAVWYCRQCGQHMIDIAHARSEHAEFLKHIFRSESRGGALVQLRLCDNE